jgi:hypothetical protein
MIPREIRGSRRPETTSGLQAELAHLAPSFRAALHAAVRAYERAGVRYALIGGVAAGAYGQPRATKDVDFLEGDEAFDTVGAVISFRPGIPLEAHGVPIDSIPMHVEYRELYERALSEAVDSDEPGVRIASPEMVAVTKLVGGRSRDITAVAEMMHAETIDFDKLESAVQPYEKLRVAYERALDEYEQDDDL